MSWSIVLSSFPKSILKDKWPLLVLSIIDRSGLATEEEVAKILGIDLPDAKANCLKLKQNDLIDYGSNHVKLSVKGFQLMERLNLQDEVMDDFLDSLNLTSEEREEFEKILKLYRKTSFKLYQNSMCTLRQWRNISIHHPITEKDISDQITKESYAGMRSLLYRDLRNWFSHYKPSKNITESLSDRTRLLLFIDNIDVGKLYKQKDFTHNCSIDFLQDLKISSNQKVKYEKKYYLINLFKHFNQFQSCYEPDLWFDKWTIEVKVPNWKKYKKASNYFENLNNNILDYTPHKSENVSIFTILQKQWRDSSSEPKPSKNFFEELFLSNNLEELSKNTGVSEESIKILLENISGACQKLLKESPPKNNIENAQPVVSADKPLN